EPYQALVDDLLARSATTEALEMIDRLASRALEDALQVGGALTGAFTQWRQPNVVAQAATAGAPGEVLINVDGQQHAWLLRAQGQRITVRDLGSRDDVSRLRSAFIADPNDRQTARALGGLLAPADVIKRDDHPLFIVATGEYRRVPYAALRRGERYLVQDRALVFVPSLASMKSCRPKTDAGPAVALGDPEGDLPYARQEAQWVASYLGVKPVIGDGATRAAIYSGTKSLLHLAGHAERDVGGVRLRMADGPLTVAEILERPLPVNAVFLASCASNASRHQEMWGSLTAAFLVAGARHVISTLSSVRDEAAFSLAQRFYRQGGATDPIGALARAQRTAAQDLPGSHWETFAVSMLNDECASN
ncbi:MAG TPA: CHAT domain-containing protein, partial [Polyangia bacterium]